MQRLDSGRGNAYQAGPKARELYVGYSSRKKIGKEVFKDPKWVGKYVSGAFVAAVDIGKTLVVSRVQDSARLEAGGASGPCPLTRLLPSAGLPTWGPEMSNDPEVLATLKFG